MFDPFRGCINHVRGRLWHRGAGRLLSPLNGAMDHRLRCYRKISAGVSDLKWALRRFLCNGSSGRHCRYALRVDKRRSYYRYFHSIEISERKTSALIAYWVIKFHPFILDSSPEGAGQDLAFRSFINEHFAAYLLIAPCLDNRDKITEVFGDAERAYGIIRSSDYYQKLVYSLRYRNIPIDSFVLLAETIVPEAFMQKFENCI